MIRKCLHIVLLTALLVIQTPLPSPQAQATGAAVMMPTIGLRGLKVYPDNPLRLSFIIENAPMASTNNEDVLRLIKYFLAALTIPDQEIWVNLSPFEKDRMITSALAETDLGKDLLEEDHALKQFSAALLDPRHAIGQEYWANNKEVTQAVHKVWIMPNQARVYEVPYGVFINQSTLKVLSDHDYQAMRHQGSAASSTKQNFFNQQLIPRITDEVNGGVRFYRLRQMYQALILAKWYKSRLAHALLGNGYKDQKKINGIDMPNEAMLKQIYENYLIDYRRGIVNRIDVQRMANGQVQARKYFSGGLVIVPEALSMDNAMSPGGTFQDIEVDLTTTDQLMEIALKAMMLDMAIGVIDHRGPFDLPTTMTHMVMFLGRNASQDARWRNYEDIVLELHRNFNKLRYEIRDYFLGKNRQGDEFVVLAFDQYLKALKKIKEQLMAIQQSPEARALQIADQEILDRYVNENLNAIEPVIQLMNQEEGEPQDIRKIFDDVQWEHKEHKKGGYEFPVIVRVPKGSLNSRVNALLLKRAVERVVENAQQALNKNFPTELKMPIMVPKSFSETDQQVARKMEEQRQATLKAIAAPLGNIEIDLIDGGKAQGNIIRITNKGRISDKYLHLVKKKFSNNEEITAERKFFLDPLRADISHGGIGSSFIFFVMRLFNGEVQVRNISKEINGQQVSFVQIDLILPKADSAQSALPQVNGGIDFNQITLDAAKGSPGVYAGRVNLDHIAGLRPVIIGRYNLPAVKEFLRENKR